MSETAQQSYLWALFRSAVYLSGRGITFGAPLVPAAAINTGIYSLPFSLVKANGIAAMDQSLGIIADGSLDHVLVTPQVEACDSPQSLLREASRKLRVGGHLILFCRLGVSQPGLKTMYREEVLDWLREMAHWQTKSVEEHEGFLLVILKRVEGRRGIDAPKARSAKRACIARYGALGDAIIMTPLVRQLAEDGYEVTLNISRYCAPVFENNPYVSNVLIHERDIIPNHLLGPYWRMWEAEYDRYINLSESIEGDLLQIEGRPQFFTTQAWRANQARHNYYDYTMRRGGYPDARQPRGELFFTTAEERRAARFFAERRDKFVVVWALNGSSHHKVYPLMEPTLIEWFAAHPDSQVITVGDYQAKLLEFEHPQLITKAGEWSIRESLISTKYADLVIGPETMITNAVGCFDTPKIVLLSHSSRHNLTAYFENDLSLEPDREIAPCYPCHQLHYTKESCPVGEMSDTTTGESLGQAPICSMGISPQRLLAQMELAYEKWASQRHAACEVA